MDSIKERLNQIDHKLRQVGGKMSMLKRQNMQLLSENVRLKKQIEKNKSNNFVGEREEIKEIDNDHASVAIREDQVEKWNVEIDEYVSKINACIEDLQKL
ncbi:hypothetical protein KUV50_08790 [Membranicola marinus]|uniref:Uncharacterized protein n=1 Tax=Membranihabitans marinus TaxID=1227546 RepID=A0A953HLM4_9BACT|nr:hypothetical protein [Membranihabitans marinus]MBY5958224.1 hypothetical protein [Membranihabitans marinus]